MIDQAIWDLVCYARRQGLIQEEDTTWAVNALLEVLKRDTWAAPEGARERPLEDILRDLLDDAAARGLIHDDTTARDLFDTALMGRLTPRPAWVIQEFFRRYQASPAEATD